MRNVEKIQSDIIYRDNIGRECTKEDDIKRERFRDNTKIEMRNIEIIQR